MAGELLPRQQFAMCRCGCGQTPPIATQTYRKKNRIKGEPLIIVPGHQSKWKRRPKTEPNPSGKCMCGCGLETTMAPHSDNKRGMLRGRPRKFIKGHWLRLPGKASRVRQGVREPRPEPPKVASLCLGCFQRRPVVAIIDGVCVVCLARAKRLERIGWEVRRHQKGTLGRSTYR